MSVIKIQGTEVEGQTKLIARACFLSGFQVQSFCLPGKGYVKFDKKPILSKQEEFPDFLLLADNSMDMKDAIKHAKEKSVIIINSKEKPNLQEAKKRKLRVYSLDATEMAVNTLRKPVPDAVMLGALARYCENITTRASKTACGESKELHLAFEEGFKNAK